MSASWAPTAPPAVAVAAVAAAVVVANLMCRGGGMAICRHHKSTKYKNKILEKK